MKQDKINENKTEGNPILIYLAVHICYYRVDKQQIYSPPPPLHGPPSFVSSTLLWKISGSALVTFLEIKQMVHLIFWLSWVKNLDCLVRTIFWPISNLDQIWNPCVLHERIKQTNPINIRIAILRVCVNFIASGTETNTLHCAKSIHFYFKIM